MRKQKYGIDTKSTSSEMIISAINMEWAKGWKILFMLCVKWGRMGEQRTKWNLAPLSATWWTHNTRENNLKRMVRPDLLAIVVIKAFGHVTQHIDGVLMVVLF